MPKIETITLDDTNTFLPAFMRIVAISDNANSFGLRGVVLIDPDTLRGWEVGANKLWLKGKQVGDDELVPCDINTGAPRWDVIGVEIAESLGVMPERLAKDLGLA